MFDSPIEYAPDLDWLLQSDQAPPEIILEGLIHEYYSDVYYLAISILDSRPAARTLAGEIFARAVLERHTYRPQIGGRDWLFRIALETCLNSRKRLQVRRTFSAALPRHQRTGDLGDSQPATALDADIWLALDALEDTPRATALLNYLHAWSLPDLERLLERPQAEIEAELELARGCVLDGLLASAALVGREQSPNQDDLDEMIRSSLRRRWSRREFTPAQLDELAQHIDRRLLRKSDRRRVAVSMLEIAVVLLIIFFAVAVFWGADRLFPEPTPTSPTGFGAVVTRLTFEVTATPRVSTAIPTPRAATPEVAGIPAEAYRTAETGDTWEAIAQDFGVSVEALQQFNRVPPQWILSPGERLLNPGGWPDLGQDTTPSNTSPSFGQPMELAQAVDMAPRYDTLWLDALALYYGPLSYLGPPRVYRVQAWRSQEQALTLAGPNRVLFPEAVWLRLGTSELTAQPFTELPWFSPWQDRGLHPLQGSENAATTLLYSLVERGDLSMQDTLRIIGRENIAGIDTLLVDQTGENGKRISRFWLDDRSGLVLHRIFYSSEKSDMVTREFRIRSLSYNPQIPANLLTDQIPWRGGYARNAQGDPDSPQTGYEWNLPRRPILAFSNPPLGYDPAAARLTFQYPREYPGSGLSSDVALFADNYYMGKVAFGDPWTTICERSPDGRWIAYVSAPEKINDRFEDSLRVFRIDAPTFRNFTLGGRAGVTEFAFSPDSLKLAFLERMPEGVGSLAILDIESRDITRLMSVWDVRSLVWSPDGQNLAMIAHMDETRTAEHVIVVNTAKDNQMTYSSAIDVQSHRDQKDWPMDEWGVEFPVEQGGLDHCAQPPNE